MREARRQKSFAPCSNGGGGGDSCYAAFEAESVAEELSSPELTFCADSYSVPVPPLVTAVARKRPMSFCKRCRWQVTPKQAYSFDPTKSEWADHAADQA